MFFSPCNPCCSGSGISDCFGTTFIYLDNNQIPVTGFFSSGTNFSFNPGSCITGCPSSIVANVTASASYVNDVQLITNTVAFVSLQLATDFCAGIVYQVLQNNEFFENHSKKSVDALNAFNCCQGDLYNILTIDCDIPPCSCIDEEKLYLFVFHNYTYEFFGASPIAGGLQVFYATDNVEIITLNPTSDPCWYQGYSNVAQQNVFATARRHACSLAVIWGTETDLSHYKEAYNKFFQFNPSQQSFPGIAFNTPDYYCSPCLYSNATGFSLENAMGLGVWELGFGGKGGILSPLPDMIHLPSICYCHKFKNTMYLNIDNISIMDTVVCGFQRLGTYICEANNITIPIQLSGFDSSTQFGSFGQYNAIWKMKVDKQYLCTITVPPYGPPLCPLDYDGAVIDYYITDILVLVNSCNCVIGIEISCSINNGPLIHAFAPIVSTSINSPTGCSACADNFYSCQLDYTCEPFTLTSTQTIDSIENPFIAPSLLLDISLGTFTVTE